MRKENGLTPAEAEFERVLAGLQPASVSIDRDALLYRAGYQAASRHNRPWQGLAALLAIGLAASLAMQGLPRPGAADRQTASMSDAERVRQVLASSEPAEQEQARPIAPSYLLLRNEVLEKGLVVLPGPAVKKSGPSPAPTLRELLGEPGRPVNPRKQLSIMDRILLGEPL